MRLTLLCALTIGGEGMLFSQGTPSTQPAVTRTNFVNIAAVPSPVRAFIQAFGDRILKAGNERTTLVGTYTDAKGSTPATLTWQVPGELRFDRTGAASLIYAAGTVQNAASISSADLNVLESLLDDSAESFFYGFMRGDAHRLIGRRYRADDGTTPNYQGPWYDIYIRSASALAQSGAPLRQSFCFFDSQTKLLAKVQYDLPNSTKVLTEFTNWITTNGQSFPGQIVRKENDAVVFTFKITGAVASPAVTDGVFPGE